MGNVVDRTGRKLLDCVRGFVDEVPPMWIMRQAGRYLPNTAKLGHPLQGS